jgi:hypothetical protein
VDGMNGPTSPLLRATSSGTTIHAYMADSTTGANGNRFALYSFATGSATWDSPAQTFSHGTSPTQWRVTIDFSSLTDQAGAAIPTNKVRKLRWTYSADVQAGAFGRSEFAVAVSNWTVSGTGRDYSVAGPGSLRFEDSDSRMVYAGTWSTGRGNYSGGSIHSTQTSGDTVTLVYTALQTHTLYLGTRFLNSGAKLAITVDSAAPVNLNLCIPSEDVLIRWPVGQFAAGTHTVSVAHDGIGNPVGTVGDFYFDFIELGVPSTTLPSLPDEPRMTLATDWDTDHSLALAPERTAWLIDTLGFKGRQNHYMGALWFYELVNPGNQYATGTVTFTGTPTPGYFVSIFLGRDDSPPGTPPTQIQKGTHGGDTLATLATSFAQELNNGYTAVWASASGNVLTVQSRSLGADGNHITLSASSTTTNLTPTASGSNFTGGQDGKWFTDLAAAPRLNRAARDWVRSFFAALHGYGIDAAASFSMELRDVDDSVAAGMVQRGPAGDAILLPTPSYQTNFSPTSLDFWKQVHADMAAVQIAAGLQPYLQFGEVQWWYFPNDGLGNNFSGMPFYDAWTAGQFLATYGRAMTVFTDNTIDPTLYPDEAAFLPAVIGNFTGGVMSYVVATYSTARFEVLYPVDVNQTAFNRAINFPLGSWTPAALTCLKIEGFGFTLQRSLDKAEQAMSLDGFPAAQRSHLVGVGDPTTAWLKEAQSAAGKGFESVVLFALDQYCLVGYATPLPENFRRSVRMGR